MDLSADINNFETTYSEGFLQSEINELVTKYQSIDLEKFNESLFGVTCVVREKGFVFYRSDVLEALRCGINLKQSSQYFWD